MDALEQAVQRQLEAAAGAPEGDLERTLEDAVTNQLRVRPVGPFVAPEEIRPSGQAIPSMPAVPPLPKIPS